MTSVELIYANLQIVRGRVRAAAARSKRHPDDVTLVAVTKSVGVAEAQVLVQHGVTALGENRVQELVRKSEALDDPRVDWHMIGRLQTKKVNKVVRKAALIHSVDSVRLARKIDAAGATFGMSCDVLLQVNVSGEGSKTGFGPEELDGALAEVAALPRLAVRGLMTMAPLVDDPEETRPLFRRLCELRDRFRRNVPTLRHLSMGMTQDFEVAVEEGATLIRVGTALFRKE
jgi:hypothetical protein